MASSEIEASTVEHERQCTSCQHCGGPVEINMKRFIHVGDRRSTGTFAVGCSELCCAEAAITLQEFADELRAAQRCRGR